MRATGVPAAGTTRRDDLRAPAADHDDDVDGDAIDAIDPAVHARRWMTLATLCLSLLIIVMDNTILNVAIPSLINDLNASNSQVQWILDSYILVFAGLLLTAGALSDRFGRKGALQIGMGLFAVGSVIAALSTTANQLIGARAFMGIGAALIMPATLSILTNVFRDPKERARAIAIWAGVAGLGVAIGPVAGGLLLEHFSWSSVFWINLPIGAAGIVAAIYFVPTSRDPHQTRLDPVAAVLSIVGFAALVFAIIEGPNHGWASRPVVVAFVVAAVAIPLFIVWEQSRTDPMLPLSFFKNPRFSTANVALALVFFALMGSLFLMTQYLQLVQGYSPLEAGIRIVPHALVMMIAAPLSARAVEYAGTKRVVTGGLVLISAALVWMSFLTVGTSYPKVIGLLCMMSVGMGMTMAPSTEAIMGALPRAKAGIGSALNNTTRQVGGALGVAVVGSVVSSVYTNRIDTIGQRFGVTGRDLATAEGSLGGALDVATNLGPDADAFAYAVRSGFIESFSTGLWFGAAVTVIAAIVVWRFLPAHEVAMSIEVVPPRTQAANVTAKQAMPGNNGEPARAGAFEPVGTVDAAAETAELQRAAAHREEAPGRVGGASGGDAELASRETTGAHPGHAEDRQG